MNYLCAWVIKVHRWHSCNLKVIIISVFLNIHLLLHWTVTMLFVLYINCKFIDHLPVSIWTLTWLLRCTLWFIISGTFCLSRYSSANKRYFCVKFLLFVVLIITQFGHKCLSLCDLYLVITASAWHNFLCCVYVAIFAMVFTEEDKIAIKFLRENKHYRAKHFLAEFPSKPWLLTGLNRKKSTRPAQTPVRQVPDDCGRCNAMTTSSTLSSLRWVRKTNGPTGYSKRRLL